MHSQKAQRVLKARAIVINEKSVGESNKQLTLFAKDMGKLTVFAKGAKNQKSKFLSGAQVFSYCDFVLYDGGDFLSVTQVELLRNFSLYYNDILKLMYGTYFLELSNRTVMFSQEANDIMKLLLKGLHMLEKTGSPKKISAAFQIKLFDYLGLCPDTVCSLCGKSADNAKLFYSQAGFSLNNGFVCENCRDGACADASEGLLAAVNYIKSAKEAGEVFKFDISENVLNELHSVAEMIVKSQIEERLNSLEIIKNL